MFDNSGSFLPEWSLILYGGVFNGAWEFLHSPLYTDHSRGVYHVLWTRAHCTVGDVMILLFSFWITSLVIRDRNWMRRERNVPAGLMVLFGVTYTIFSEWHNVYVRESWAYAEIMPELFGMGLSPIVQWLVLPPLVILVIRKGWDVPFNTK